MILKVEVLDKNHSALKIVWPRRITNFDIWKGRSVAIDSLSIQVEALWVEAFIKSQSFVREALCVKLSCLPYEDCPAFKIAQLTRLPSLNEKSCQLKWISRGKEERGWCLIQYKEKTCMMWKIRLYKWWKLEKRAPLWGANIKKTYQGSDFSIDLMYVLRLTNISRQAYSAYVISLL